MNTTSTVAPLPPQWASCFDTNAPVWTRRELLSFPDLMPGEYSLPFFQPTSELDAVVFTDVSGNVLRYCEDQLYEALDHRLLWINPTREQWGEDLNGEWEAADWQSSIYLYHGLQSQDDSAESVTCAEAQPSSNRDVLLFTDYFADGTAESPHEGWERCLREGEDLDVSSSYVWVGPLPESQVDDQDPVSQSQQQYGNQALRIDPGLGRIALCHSTGDNLTNRAGGCLYLRAHFYDSMRERAVLPAHWMGLTSQYGSAAVGLGGDSRECYAVLNGSCPDGSPGLTCPWQETTVIRSKGWHLFEMHLDSNSLSILIDGELVVVAPSEGQNYEREQIWLVGKRGDVGHWAAVELIHRPRGLPPSCDPRRTSNLFAGDRSPWLQQAKESGRWQVVEKQGPTVMWGGVDVEEPQPAEATPPVPEPPAPAPATGVLSIECWSIAGESDMARIDRVMAVFLEQLVAAGVVMPENFNRIGRCGARGDPQPCYIYRFGTRRLHINVREGEGGRLCLVVRCGGGYLDFAEFARKNGNTEQLKSMKMQQPNGGRAVLQLSSVYTKGERRVKEYNSSSNASRPSLSRSGRGSI